MSRAAEAAMAASYKSLKEDFVSGLTGGDISEINYVTAVAPVSSFFTLLNLLTSRRSQLFFGQHYNLNSRSLNHIHLWHSLSIFSSMSELSSSQLPSTQTRPSSL